MVRTDTWSTLACGTELLLILPSQQRHVKCSFCHSCRGFNFKKTKKKKTFRMLLVNFQFNGSNMSDRVEMWLIKGLHLYIVEQFQKNYLHTANIRVQPMTLCCTSSPLSLPPLSFLSMCLSTKPKRAKKKRKERVKIWKILYVDGQKSKDTGGAAIRTGLILS